MMPGINLIAGSQALSSEVTSRFECIQKKMLHFSSYTNHIVLSNKKVVIGITAYPAYPRQELSISDTFTFIEGLIYNKKRSQLENELHALLDTMETTNIVPKDSLAKFVRETDGEYLICIYEQHNEVLIIMNDSIGNLPFYYSIEGNVLIASREIKFILPFLSSVRFKKSALMEYLQYGYPFAENTFVENVYHLAPSSILTFDCKRGAISKSIDQPDDFESTHWMDPKLVVNTMSHHFLEGLSCRVQTIGKHNAVLALSGGLDSRATLAALNRIQTNIQAITIEGPEECIAKQCAKEFGIPIESITNNRGSQSLIPRRSIFLKDGMDSEPSQEVYHSILAEISGKYGNKIIFYTGGYGGETCRCLHPTSGMNSLESLVDHLTDPGYTDKYSTEKTAKLFGTDENIILESLSRHLQSFPEKNTYGKYARFRYEYDTKVGGQGDDRNRFYFWSIAPFRSLGFFRFIMSIDQNHKNTRLFRDFLFKLDKKTCKINSFNYPILMNNTFYLLMFTLLERAARCRGPQKALRRMSQYWNRLYNRSDSHVDVIRNEALDILDIVEKDVQEYCCVATCRDILRHDHDYKGVMRIYIMLYCMYCMKAWRRQFN